MRISGWQYRRGILLALAQLVTSVCAADSEPETFPRFSLLLADGAASGAKLEPIDVPSNDYGDRDVAPRHPALSADPIHPLLRLGAAFGYLQALGKRFWIRDNGGPDCGAQQAGEQVAAVRIRKLLGPLSYRDIESVEEIGAVLIELEAPTEALLARVDELSPRIGTAENPAAPRILAVEPDTLGAPVAAARGGVLERCTPGNGDDVFDARRLIMAVPLGRAVQVVPPVALFDSGVSPPTRDSVDCTDYSSPVPIPLQDCLGRDPSDTSSRLHGTKSARILAGVDDDGYYRGVTTSAVRSYKIAERDKHDRGAVVRAFRTAIANQEKVILVEVADPMSSDGTLSTLADCAYSSGAVVVAPSGNESGWKKATSPGNARLALGIGAVDIRPPYEMSLTGVGPTEDGRTKPDLLAPTDTETALWYSSTGDRRCGRHDGTSGAAPYAAGAAALLKGLIISNFPGEVAADDPGLVYALLIVSGRKPYECELSQQVGAGLIRLPADGKLAFGWVNIEPYKSMVIPAIDKIATGWVVDAALWWPESRRQLHVDIDLRIRNPFSGWTGVEAVSYGSVFERSTAIVEAGDVDGTEPWALEITAESGATGASQRVYWAVIAAPPPACHCEPTEPVGSCKR